MGQEIEGSQRRNMVRGRRGRSLREENTPASTSQRASANGMGRTPTGGPSAPGPLSALRPSGQMLVSCLSLSSPPPLCEASSPACLILRSASHRLWHSGAPRPRSAFPFSHGTHYLTYSISCSLVMSLCASVFPTPSPCLTPPEQGPLLCSPVYLKCLEQGLKHCRNSANDFSVNKGSFLTLSIHKGVEGGLRKSLQPFFC